MLNNFYIVMPLMNLRLKLVVGGRGLLLLFSPRGEIFKGDENMEAADSESCNAELAEFVQFDDDDDYIARLQREGAWDEDIDAELSKLVSMQEIREGVTTGEQTSDVSNLVSSAEPTCVADAVRRANESLSPRPLSNVWEEGVYDAIFTGDMTKWLDIFDSSLHRLVGPPDFLLLNRSRAMEPLALRAIWNAWRWL